MTMIDKIVDGFTKFIAFMGNLFGRLFTFLGNLLGELFDLLAKPLSYLLAFLDGIFYFITVFFQIVIKIVMIFVALFQFMGALFLGVFRTIRSWLTVSVTPNTKFPSATHEGFSTVMDIVAPTGLLTVVPLVAIAFLWFFFVLKMISLLGGEIHVNVNGNSSNGK